MGSTEIASDSTSIASLFELVREALVDVLGSAATATLLERVAKRVASCYPDLAELRIRRIGFDYRYQLPETWTRHDPSAWASFQALCGELESVLIAFTGDVVLRRLARLPAVARHGLFRAARGG